MKQEKHNVRGTIIPRCIKFNKNLNLYERVVLEAFIDRENALMTDNFYCYEEWLEDNLGISSSTIKRAIKTLKQQGWINVTKKNKTNTYTINWDKIESEDSGFTTNQVFIKKEVKKPLETIAEEVLPTEAKKLVLTHYWDTYSKMNRATVNFVSEALKQGYTEEEINNWYNRLVA